SGVFVVQGEQSNDQTFNVSRKTVQQFQLMFRNSEHSFNFSADERSRIVWAATNSLPQYFERAHSHGSGDGTWNGRAAVFTGTIELSGGSTNHVTQRQH